MRTLSAGQEIERVKHGVNIVWLIVGEFQMYLVDTETKRYATSALAVSGENYADALASVRWDMTRLKTDGGLSPVPGFSISIRDEERESALSGSHVMANDPVIVYAIFYTASEANSDRIELIRGVVERDATHGYLWTWNCKDGSRRDFRHMPADTLNPVTYPYAWTPGLPLPEAFGHLNVPHSAASSSVVSLAPCKFTNRFALECTASLNAKTYGTMYQWYQQSGRFAEIDTSIESGGIITVSDPDRTMRLRPSRPKTSNDVATYRYAMDDREDTSADIVLGDNLDLWMTGTPQLGTLTEIAVVVKASGSYDLIIYDDAVEKSNTTPEGDVSITLTVGDYSDAWDFDLLNVEIDGTGNAQIKQVYLQIKFKDYMAFQEQEPEVFQSLEGFEDNVGHYEDGAVIAGAGTALRNPAHQLWALLRAKNMCALETAVVNSAYFDTAAALRTDWKFDWAFSVNQGQVREEFLDRLAYEAGLMTWKKNGTWRVVARDKSAEPQHFFLGDYHLANRALATSGQMETSLEIIPADASQIYNEVAIRYCPHPATGEAQLATISSGQYRIQGTCTLDASTSVLADEAAAFISNGVVARSTEGPGERIYVEGDVTYEVLEVLTQTTLRIVAVAGGPVDDKTTATPYHLGPNLSGDAFISQEVYKVVNALGGKRQRTFREIGGFNSTFIRDTATAQLLRDMIINWDSRPRDRIRFILHHVGMKLEEGDVFLFDDDRLFQNNQGVHISDLVADVTDVETHWYVSDAAHGRVDDYVYVQSADRAKQPECVKITAKGTGVWDVDRGQLGTFATEHETGDNIIRIIDHKYLCTGLQAPTPDSPVFRVEAEQMPRDYYPVGVVSETGWPAWLSATGAQRNNSGWITLRNGRVVDTDTDSDVSYVGDDSGAY